MGHLDHLAFGNWIVETPTPVERTADVAGIESLNRGGPVRV